MNPMSLYIPHVFANFSKEKINSLFENLLLGKISRIDFVSKMGRDGSEYNSVYIHFEYWHDTVAANNFQERVADPKREARIVYDEPWYWVVLENRGTKHTPGDRKPRVFIDEIVYPVETPQKSMTNKDFANLVNAPFKPNPPSIVFDISPRTLCFDEEPVIPMWEELEQDPQDPQLEEILDEMDDIEDSFPIYGDYSVVDATYTHLLEEEIRLLTHNLTNLCGYMHSTQDENICLTNELQYFREIQNVNYRYCLAPKLI